MQRYGRPGRHGQPADGAAIRRRDDVQQRGGTDGTVAHGLRHAERDRERHGHAGRRHEQRNGQHGHRRHGQRRHDGERGPDPRRHPEHYGAPTRSGEPAFRAPTSPESAESAEDGDLTLVRVRTGRHDGYDRVVLELRGPGKPGWFVQYVVEPVSDGSGDPLQVAGSAFLHVTVNGVVNGEGFAGRTRAKGTRQVREVLVEVLVQGAFEGQNPAYVGMAGPPRPYRILWLADPPRVVVDVRDR